VSILNSFDVSATGATKIAAPLALAAATTRSFHRGSRKPHAIVDRDDLGIANRA